MNKFLDSLVKVDIDEYILRKRTCAKENGVPILRDASFNLLLEIARIKQPKNILEIGTAVGTTSAALLLSAKTAKLTGIEIDEESIKEAKETLKHFDLLDRARIINGDAGEVIPMLVGKYDLIFLDGPKGHYAEYLPFLKDLLCENGVLVADNVLYRGHVANGKVPPRGINTIVYSMRNFLTAISQDEDFITTTLELEDGVSISVKIR